MQKTKKFGKDIESMKYVNERKDNYIKVKNDSNNFNELSKDVTVYYKDKQGKRKHLKLDIIIQKLI